MGVIVEVTGSPEEATNQTEQGSGVSSNSTEPWKNKNGMWTFQNQDDLREHFEAYSSDDYSMVLVLDCEAELDDYPNNSHYYVIAGGWYKNTLHHYIHTFKEEGEDMSSYDSSTAIFSGDAIKINTKWGSPIWVLDPKVDHSRPVTETSATTSKTTGNTVVTKTSTKPGTAGVVTESETLPAGAFTDAFGEHTGSADFTAAADRIREFQAEYANSSIARAATLQALGLPPITDSDRQSTAGGLNFWPVTSTGEEVLSANTQGIYQDAILRHARETPVVLGGRGDGAAEVARRRVDRGILPPCLADTTGIGSGQLPTQDPRGRDQRGSTSPSIVTSSQSADAIADQPLGVYVYKPLTPGFDRYDFNTGKKVYTPDNGPSRNAAAQITTPEGSN